MLNKLIGFILRHFLPSFLKQGKATLEGYGTVTASVATILGAGSAYYLDQIDADAAATMISVAVIALFQRRATANVERKVDETKQVAQQAENAAVQATAAAEQTLPIAQAREIATDAAEQTAALPPDEPGPQTKVRKAAGSGRF